MGFEIKGGRRKDFIQKSYKDVDLYLMVVRGVSYV